MTWEGSAWLPDCIAGVEAQTFADHEVLVHDNGSSDGSLELLHAYAARDARVRVTASSENEGYVAPHDRAIAVARGEIIVLLNQDVVLDPSFLAVVVAALEEHPEAAAVQARVLRLSPGGERIAIIDTTGLVMGRDRRAVSRHRGARDGPTVSTAGPVWGADGPVPAYRRRALLAARLPSADGSWEVLDRDFGMFKEDVDLAWRLRRLRWEAWYEPAAMAWHARGTGDSGARGLVAVARANRAIPATARALSWRNQRLMQIKNESVAELLRDLPWIVAREVLTLGFLVAFDRSSLGAVAGLVRAAPAAFRKRRYLGRLVAEAATLRPPRSRSPSAR